MASPPQHPRAPTPPERPSRFSRIKHDEVAELRQDVHHLPPGGPCVDVSGLCCAGNHSNADLPEIGIPGCINRTGRHCLQNDQEVRSLPRRTWRKTSSLRARRELHRGGTQAPAWTENSGSSLGLSRLIDLHGLPGYPPLWEPPVALLLPPAQARAIDLEKDLPAQLVSRYVCRSHGGRASRSQSSAPLCPVDQLRPQTSLVRNSGPRRTPRSVP
jgi:hypothetical protein